MELHLFNTLTREKEVFRPIREGHVGIYTCGPTVYAPAHIGNLRSYVFPDVLKKTLWRLGYTVNHVINVTDVGHLTSDADTGEDKLEQAARQSARSAWEIAEEYTALFLRDLGRLHIALPDTMPTATGHISEQIALVQRLEAAGFAYATDDGIYFDTARFPHYGRLARLQAEGLQEGSRVEMGGKRNKTDFALWKFSPTDAQRQMEWDSPWGKGFPGWHIECSAMSMKYLGEHFDIHTGGTDHIPVHHTNEIAQAEAATGEPFVNYWLHGEYLVLGEEKRMGKSEGNLVRLDALEAAGFEPLAFRYLALNSHYRHFLNYSTQALEAAQASLTGLRRLILETKAKGPFPPPITRDAKPENEFEQTFLENLCDDLNTPQALGTIWTTLRNQTVAGSVKVRLAAFADGILSLDLFNFGAFYSVRPEQGAAPHIVASMGEIPEEVIGLAQERWIARKSKNFGESDRLRDAIASRGYVVRDTKDGYEIEKASP